MVKVAGVKFTGTKSGKANPTRISEKEFADRYLIDAGTKRKSSLLVVDTNGFLRRGSVAQAWRYRNNTDRDIEQEIRRLARYFEQNPVREIESEGDSPDDSDQFDTMTINIEEKLAFSASTPDGDLDFSHDEFTERVGTGFNEYGVRENYNDEGELESVDVIFEAMEPGPPEDRNGVRITDEFLKNVASKDYDNPPHLKDHDGKDTFSRIGEVREQWFSERLEKLMLMVRTPNIEESRNHQEAVARYTHDPPAIRDGSLGFGQNYEAVMNDDGEPEMKDGKFREFSTVNFPGGYDEGGVNRAFSEAIEDVKTEFDDPAGDDSSESGENSAAEFSVEIEEIEI